MRLTLDTIDTEVTQRVKPSKNTQLEYIRPHLYIHNIPSGSIRVSIWTADGLNQLAQSSALPISDITSSNEYHGYVRFQVLASLQANVYYTVKIACESGYSFDESAYVGVVADLGFQKYDYSNPITSANNAPLDLEIWSRQSS
jgi:hypothetical protein